MPPEELAGAWAKIDRAVEHAQNFETLFAEFDHAQSHRVVIKYDSESGHHLVRAHLLRPVPLRFSVILGDILFNYRSALDHLAWELVMKAQNGVEPEHPNGIQFPILDLPSHWKKVSPKTTLAALSPLPGVEAALKDLQPYTDRAKDGKMGVLPHLRDLCNRDKHRGLRVIAYRSDGEFRPMTPFPRVMSVVVNPGPVEDGAVILDLTLDAPPQDVKVEFDLGVYTALEDLPEYPVLRILEVIKSACEQILDEFGRAFF